METRMKHIDALRGLAMAMVVYHHVMLRLFDTSSLMSDVCVYWRMPLFFFISGFLSGAMYNANLAKKRLGNRLRYQLVPTILMALLYSVLFAVDFHELTLEPLKKGFWFPLVLVEISLSYILTAWLMGRIGWNGNRQAVVLLIVALVVGGIRLTMGRTFDYRIEKVLDLLSIRECLYYAPYFYLGAIAKIYQKTWEKLSMNWLVIAVSVAIFVVECKWFDFDLSMPYLKGCIGIMAAWGAFGLIHRELSNTKAMDMMGAVGRKTLPIYLLHYFLIGLLAMIIPAGLDDIDKPLINVLMHLTCTVVVIAISLGLSGIVKRWPWIYKLTLGKM